MKFWKLLVDFRSMFIVDIDDAAVMGLDAMAHRRF
jgi:hypothetical protein